MNTLKLLITIFAASSIFGMKDSKAEFGAELNTKINQCMTKCEGPQKSLIHKECLNQCLKK